MMNLIRELRRREVFRTAGLYVGIAWILIEGASVLLEAFDAPGWMLQGMIILAIIGLPVTVVLAWIFDITEKGIEVQAEATDTVVIPFGGRKGDFVVIGVLTVALAFSVYLNITIDDAAVGEEIEPLSILIADFDNQTGDPLFEGSLEQALQIGLEVASFVSSYERGVAKKIAGELQSTEALDSEVAQLVAVREGIKLVLAGSIVPDGSEFELAVQAVAPRSGEIIAEVDTTAPSKLEVLTAMGELAAELRAELGDESVDRDNLEVTETFTAMSLEAAREYDTAQQLQYNAKYEQAIEHYRAAVEHDPGFGRAYSGWAVAARKLGLVDEASKAWDKAIANLGTMTERERLRTQGIYYWGVTRNFQKAIETYETLVEKYPADFVGRNNLAVAKFFALDFEGAVEEGEHALGIYPANAIARSNYALYAMYSSDLDTAVAEAHQVREIDPTWFAVWLPIAMQSLSAGDLDAARAAYENMRETSPRGASTAKLGLADVELFTGDFASAREILAAAITVDAEGGNAYGGAVKQLALAEALLGEGDSAAADEAIRRGLEMVSIDATLVPAALMYAGAANTDNALEIATALAEKLSPQSRAYAGLIRGVVALNSGESLQAIEHLTAAAEMADLWLVRFYLGRAYFEGGYFVEALDEFTAASDRHGEATAVFLDDLPSYRYMATVPYWLGRTQAELGMRIEAAKNFNIFVARRPPDEPLAEDARQRLQ
jgi:tetratricopeptide (TPR) repeat protein